MHKRQTLLVVAIAAALAWSGAARAENGAGLGAKKEDACRKGGLRLESKTLSINGVVGQEDTFTGVLRVTAVRKKVKPVFLVSQNLAPKYPQGRSPLRRSQITIDSPETDLPVKEPRDLQLKIANVRFAGEYDGELFLASSAGCKLELTVIATAVPELSLIGTGEDRKVQLRLARCTRYQCGPKEWFGQPETLLNSVVVKVDNASQSPVYVTGLRIVLRGDPGERAPPASAFLPDSSEVPFTLAARTPSKLPEIKINRALLSPDHYTGGIYLTVDNGRDRVTLPLEVDVKNGPVGAVVALLLALFVYLLQAVVKRFSEHGEEIRKLGKLRNQALVLDVADKRIAVAVIETAEALVLDDQVAKGKQWRESLEETLPFLKDVRERQIAAPKPLPQDVTSLLRKFRKAVREARTADAKAKYEALKEKLAPAAPLSRTRIGVWFLARALAQKPVLFSRLALETALTTTAPHARIRRLVLKVVIRSLPRVVRVVAVVSFVLLGLKELYFDDHTFGERWLPDYGALFLWGIGATAVDKVVAKLLPSSAGQQGQS